MAAKFELDLCVRGFHVYQHVWKPEIGETLQCRIEENPFDKNAVAVVRQDKTVGHVPKEHSKVCRYFIARGGVITVAVIGKRRNTGVGLEIPARYTFTGVPGDVIKLTKLLR